MAEFTGQNLKVSWVYGTSIFGGGTLDLSGDYRACSYKPTIGKVTGTAGSDTFESYLMTVKDTVVDVTAVAQTGGTLAENVLLPGTFGTLIIQPEGTAANLRKYTIPAFSMGANFNYQYANEVEIACQFQGSGTPTIGAN